MAVLPPRSIPPWAPPLDRLAVRAAAATAAAWPRHPAELAELVGEAVGRGGGRWVGAPEAALLDALRRRAGPDATLAVPAWGGSSPWAGRPLGFRDVRWMEPAAGRLDPGPAEVGAALDAGATAVLLAPPSGDCSALPAIVRQCDRRGAVIALDARAAAGSRVLDSLPERLGHLTLAATSGEPGPAACPGAFLFGDPEGQPDEARGHLLDAVGLGVALLRQSIREEPRLHRFGLGGGAGRRDSATRLERRTSGAPGWAVAAAAARLQQAAHRASQRARHLRLLRSNCSHIEGVEVVDDPVGCQSAGVSLPILVEDRDAVAARLASAGVPTLQGWGTWLAPPDLRGPRARDIAGRALFLPVHPFYRHADIVFISETLRRAALGAAGS